MVDLTWTVEKVSDLIDYYEGRPCLYDIKNKDYHNKDKRNNALEEMSELLGFSSKIVF